MEIANIKIADMEIDHRLGEAFSFSGVFSMNDLSGITIRLNGLDEIDQKRIEEIIRNGEANVEDPFTQSQYRAKVIEVSNSYTVGTRVKSYEIKVEEVDLVPDFKEIEINGASFDVISYREYLTSNTVGREGMLKLTENQFKKFRNLLSEKFLEVRRIGVDEEVIILRFGSQMFWSEHFEGSEVYYKHIFRMFEVTLESSGMNLASSVIQHNAVNMLVNLDSQFKELLKVLTQENSLSTETRTLLNDISLEKNEDSISNPYDLLEKVKDAERLLR